MNATLIQSAEQVLNAETDEAQVALTELRAVELSYVGGGMANFSFV
jgi:hypothetical protein